MDPLSVGLLLGGGSLNLLGDMFSQQSALDNATAQANARNAVVRQAIGQLDQYGAQNRGTFNTLMGGYDPATQAAQLANDQAKRSGNNVAAITTDDPNATPIQSDASPATRSDLAKRMLAVHDQAVSRAQAQGALGGYSDTWLQNEINNAQAGRDISVVNNYAEGRKALVQPEADLAAAAAYKPPSIWGSLLSGVGGILLGAGGQGLTGGGSSFGGFNYGNGSGFDPSGLLSGSDLAAAARAGVNSGLTFNPSTGSVV